MHPTRPLLRRILGATVLALASFGATAGATPAFSNAYYFGDSLSDTGNIFALTAGANPPPPYFNGRFSDGPVWVEYLAAGIGLPLSDRASLQGGNNFAFGGALTSGGGIPSLLAQVGGLTSTPGSLDPNALYVVVAGGNDMRAARSTFQTNSAIDANGRALAAQTAVGHLATALGLLAADGARNVLVANLPDLGATPEAFGLGLVAASTDASFQFNSRIPGLLATGAGLGLNMSFLDMAGLAAAVRVDALTNGGLVYGITNALMPCGAFQGSIGASCSVSLFSDALHPSGRANELIGSAALMAVAVPEPASILLLGMGVLALLAWRRQAPKQG